MLKYNAFIVHSSFDDHASRNIRFTNVQKDYSPVNIAKVLNPAIRMSLSITGMCVATTQYNVPTCVIKPSFVKKWRIT